MTAEAAEWVAVPARLDRTTGERVVTLYDAHGRPHTKPVAELVLEAFIGPRPTPEHAVRYRDGDRSNSALANLEWTTNPRPVHVDEQGRITERDGTPLVFPGLEPEAVRAGLADLGAGRTRSLREIIAGRRR